MIPARYAATRFPFKLMEKLGDKTVIRHTYENTLATGLFDDVLVVTDSPEIFDEISAAGGKAVMSKGVHESGTDRIAEAVSNYDADIILNVQGDEPFVQKEPLALLLKAFDTPEVKVASLMKPFTDVTRAQNPNIVKVVVGLKQQSLFFSRCALPFHRDAETHPGYFEHIGVYAFRKQALLQFTQWQPTPLELKEKIECLRFLEHGIQLQMVITHADMIKIDVPSDLEIARNFLKSYRLQ